MWRYEIEVGGYIATNVLPHKIMEPSVMYIVHCSSKCRCLAGVFLANLASTLGLTPDAQSYIIQSIQRWEK